MGYEEALRRIEEARETGATELDLNGLDLTELPPLLFQLTNLTKLDISFNKLTELSPDIAQLNNLLRLELTGNQLTELPSQLFQLTKLIELDLGGNQLTELSSNVIQLNNLTGLYLTGNRQIRLPRQLFQLINLNNLKLGDLWLTSLPEELFQLTNLTDLYLAHNHLVALSPKIGLLTHLARLVLYDNYLTQLPSEVYQLTNLIYLDLSDNKFIELSPQIVRLSVDTSVPVYRNPLTSPPYELAIQGFKAIHEYFAALEEGTRIVGEVKVILIGEGASGKTSLTRCLRDERFNQHEETTHGIRIKNWQLDTGDQELRCNLWDFGGQEIMHATHQFFLSRRSLYVLVLDGRRDERPEYWLRYIESFGGGSPVLVVLNKYDTNPGFDLDRPFLLEKYPFIAGFWRTSCCTGNGIRAFKQALLEELVNVPMVHTRWPGSWFRVKAKFEQMSEPCISYECFTGICVDAGVNEAGKQDVLAEFLHDLGIVIHFSDFGLDDNHVLEPKWVTGAVYKIINAESVAADKGLLRLDALKDILRLQDDDPYIYRRADHRYIIELMKKFELCYELPGEEVLIPQLLAVPQPQFDFPTTVRFALSSTIPTSYRLRSCPASSLNGTGKSRISCAGAPGWCWPIPSWRPLPWCGRTTRPGVSVSRSRVRSARSIWLCSGSPCGRSIPALRVCG